MYYSNTTYSRIRYFNPCTDKHSCLNSDQCVCYDSMMCTFRAKQREGIDKPVFYENDPYGVYCYCSQWDKDNHLNRKCTVNQSNYYQDFLERTKDLRDY